MTLKLRLFAAVSLLLASPLCADEGKRMSGNPLFEGWYADPEGIIFGDTYWIIQPTRPRTTNSFSLTAFRPRTL